MTDLIDWLLRVGRSHLDIVAILLGTGAGNAASLILERYFIPETMPGRQQQGITVIVALVAGASLSYLTWGVLDPTDSASMRSIVSISAAILAVIIYPIVARLATARWPAIGSIWAQPK